MSEKEKKRIRKKHRKLAWTILIAVNLVVTLITVKGKGQTIAMVTCSFILHDWIATII